MKKKDEEGEESFFLLGCPSSVFKVRPPKLVMKEARGEPHVWGWNETGIVSSDLASIH